MIVFEIVRELGAVARGVEFDDGEVVVHWLGHVASTIVYHSLRDAWLVHGHENTRFVRVADCAVESFEHLELRP